MTAQVLRTLFERDLKKLKLEIESYQHEQNLWKIDGKIANSGGNLALHLVGNLNTYFGTTLGNTGYVRDRDAEFSTRNVPQKELLQKIEAVMPVVDSVLSNLTDDQLKAEYPMLVLAEKTSTEFFLIHLAMHLSYHLGQVNYHRRLLDN
jgi:uncharacterized damage-inducible protein DinB